MQLTGLGNGRFPQKSLCHPNCKGERRASFLVLNNEVDNRQIRL